MKKALSGASIVTLAFLVAACGSEPLALPADSAGTQLFEQSRAFMEEGEWSKASEGFDTLLRNYPTSPHLPQARLSLGRSYYEQDRTSTLILAVDAFRNFLTYHPSHGQVDYAQLMIAMSYLSMMRSPDRDQSQAVEALRAFEIFFEDYPGSPYAEQAQESMQRVVDNLSEHELGVADFQMSRGRYSAARQRAIFALRKYGTTSLRCEFVWIIGESHRRQGDRRQATTYFQQIVDEHAECERVRDASEWLRQGGATRPSEEDEPGFL
ncbi:MAG: outer membrane protein assembly factor BamD [Acidobacteria bacterium]|nr:outer membrane protein assembly factor BamD [Acidobacteriota bacterium]